MADLNLSSESGTNALKQLIRHAPEKVCVESGGGTKDLFCGRPVVEVTHHVKYQPKPLSQARRTARPLTVMSSRSDLALIRSTVVKPSVNRAWTEDNKSYASGVRPCSCR